MLESRLSVDSVAPAAIGFALGLIVSMQTICLNHQQWIINQQTIELNEYELYERRLEYLFVPRVYRSNQWLIVE